MGPSAPVAPATPRLAPGYRWIAVRPGPPPRQRPQRRPPGPTPHYRVIPSWGLHQYFDVDEQEPRAEEKAPAPNNIRFMLGAATVLLGVAAFAHVLRYVLLLINRGTLLPPLIAIAGTVVGLLASVLALVAVIMTVVLLTRWLIARRAAAYGRFGQPDPRSRSTLWLGCLVPGFNLVMAPLFVWELAALEDRLSHLRRSILVWWIAFGLSAVMTVCSIASTVHVTFWAPTAQNIADNTVITIVGYLVAMAVFVLTGKVFDGFERKDAAPHAVRRWVVVPTDSGPDDSPGDPAPVEPTGQNSAA